MHTFLFYVDLLSRSKAGCQLTFTKLIFFKTSWQNTGCVYINWMNMEREIVWSIFHYDRWRPSDFCSAIQHCIMASAMACWENLGVSGESVFQIISWFVQNMEGRGFDLWRRLCEVGGRERDRFRGWWETVTHTEMKGGKVCGRRKHWQTSGNRGEHEVNGGEERGEFFGRIRWRKRDKKSGGEREEVQDKHCFRAAIYEQFCLFIF